MTGYISKIYICPVCLALVPMPVVPVRNTGFLRCPKGHRFPWRKK